MKAAANSSSEYARLVILPASYGRKVRPVAALDAVLDAAREITQKRYQIGEEIPHYLYVTLQDAVRAYDAHRQQA